MVWVYGWLLRVLLGVVCFGIAVCVGLLVVVVTGFVLGLIVGLWLLCGLVGFPCWFGLLVSWCFSCFVVLGYCLIHFLVLVDWLFVYVCVAWRCCLLSMLDRLIWCLLEIVVGVLAGCFCYCVGWCCLVVLTLIVEFVINNVDLYISLWVLTFGFVCMCRSVLGLDFVSVFFGLRCGRCVVRCGLFVDLFGGVWVVVVCCVYGGMVVWHFGSVGCLGGWIGVWSVVCSGCLVGGVYWLLVFVCLVVLV